MTLLDDDGSASTYNVRLCIWVSYQQCGIIELNYCSKELISSVLLLYSPPCITAITNLLT